MGQELISFVYIFPDFLLYLLNLFEFRNSEIIVKAETTRLLSTDHVQKDVFFNMENYDFMFILLLNMTSIIVKNSFLIS